MKKACKIVIIICIFFNVFSLFACKKVSDENVFIETKHDAKEIKYIMNEPFEVYDEGLNGFAQVYIMRNQSEGQILSMYIITTEGSGIMIDGGRVEDGEYLYNFILQETGAGVDCWLLTHCHDDHVGALYSILDTEKNMTIFDFYYKFPTFDWLYKLIGVDAGAVNLIDNKIHDYCEGVRHINAYDRQYNIIHPGNICNDIKAGDVIDVDNVHIEVMNDMYLIENDPINNSTITYKIKISYYDNESEYVAKEKTIMVLGDLSYEGGKRLLEERGDDLKSDICVVAHHGQGGVWKDVYEAIDPEICIWPTTKKIYENIEGKYHTDEVKKWFEEIGVEKHYTTVNNSIMLK